MLLWRETKREKQKKVKTEKSESRNTSTMVPSPFDRERKGFWQIVFRTTEDEMKLSNFNFILIKYTIFNSRWMIDLNGYKKSSRGKLSKELLKSAFMTLKYTDFWSLPAKMEA